MITLASKYYGAVFAYILNKWGEGIEIQRIKSKSSGFYLIDKKIPIYIKYSTQRRGPWTFTIQPDQAKVYDQLFRKYKCCVFAFVCGNDGIVALDFFEFNCVFSSEFEQQGSIMIRRKLRHMYQINGRDGELDRKISGSSLIKLLESFGLGGAL